ncbi:MAG: DnaB-like helicase C-terminal domain-containing protein [Bacteroidales bacterium]
MANKINPKTTEQNILSCILRKPSIIYEIDSNINKDYFINDYNKVIYMIMVYLSKQKDVEELEFDAMTMVSIAKRFDKVKKVIKNIYNSSEEFIKTIESLRDFPVEPDNYDIHIEELKKANVVNEMVEKNHNFSDRLIQNYDSWGLQQIINTAENNVLQISNKYMGGESTEAKPIGDGLLDKYLNKEVNKNGFRGYPTPFDALNKFTDGILRKGNVCVFNAQTGVGKSITLKNIVKYIGIDLGKPIYWGGTPEMQVSEQEERLIAEVSGIDAHIISNALYNKEGNEKLRERVIEAIRTIEQAPIFIENIRGYTPEKLVQRAKYFKNKHDIVGFVWDYVKRSSAFKGDDGQLRHWLGDVVNVMKEQIAAPLDLFVATASQAKTYDPFFAAESQDIERHCTNFIVLRQLTEKEQQQNPLQGKYGFYVKKNRNGKEHHNQDWDWIPLEFDEQRLKFRECLE